MTMVNGPDLLEATLVQVEEESKESAKNLSAVNIKVDLIKQDSIAL